MKTNRQEKAAPSLQVRHALAMACVAAALVLGGCDAATETAHAAQRDAAEAARRAASAGEPRATDKLVDAIASGSDLAALQKQIEGQLKSATGDTISTEYIKQNTASKDLEDALAQVQKANRADLDPGVKSSLEAQVGATQMRLSDERFAELQSDMLQVAQQAVVLESLTQAAIELGRQADTLEQGTKAPAPADVDGAKKKLADQQAAVAAAQAKVKQLQDDIAAKEAQARQIYSQTDSAFQQADAGKGSAAIAAASKAMEDRKQAEGLMVESGNLQAQLDAAQAALALAQVQQTNAQEMVHTAQTAMDEGSAWTKQTQERIATLRAGAKKIVQDPNGVADRFKALAQAAARLDKNIQAAADYADKAAMSFNSAASDYKQYKDSVRTQTENATLEASDPLQKLLKDDRLTAILSWSKSGAQSQSGRVNLAGYQAATLAQQAADQTSEAYKAAGMSLDGKIDLDSKKYQGAATAKFTAAVETAQGANKIPSPPNGDLEKIKWLGYAVEAVGEHGLYLTGDAKALAAAKAARSSAEKGNPQMGSALSWMGS